MDINIREYQDKDLQAMTEIWNEVVEDGVAFPQTDLLTIENAENFFLSQSFSAVAEEEEEIVGVYILHPNNIGRCGHLANASYAVRSTERGKYIGEHLVKHSLQKGKELGFGVLQFNAVVKSNIGAIKLYEKLGFVNMGIVPKGYKLDNGSFEDIVLFYHTL